jgi:DNA (cytosine-5)-methyltransferase 1
MLRVLSLFSGIGAFEKALKNIGKDFELVNYCEIDKYASKAYSMIHNVSEDLNLHDVTKIDTSKLHDIDLITYGFPCQDISIAGKQKGFTDNKGNRTRSGLFFEALRIIEDTKPKYAIAENVKALTSKKFKNEFETVLNSLNNAGYTNYYAVLNAKDYGIPQNRERIFIVSIRNDLNCGLFQFPIKRKLNVRLKDYLEKEVDDKYYIDNERSRNLINQIVTKNGIIEPTPVDGTIFEPKVKDICNCIPARYDAGIQNQKSIGCMVIEPKINRLGNLYGENMGTSMGGNVYSPKGIIPTLTTSQGGNRQPLIAESNPIVIVRKLTPKECFRLMGFSDEDFDSIKGISNAQLYKMAGNSIAVNVLEAIFKNLLEE